MKRAERQARMAAVGLVLIALVLLIAGGMYGSTVFWAAGLAALGQGLLAVLAMWGLMLGRQQDELLDISLGGGALERQETPSLGGFRMSAGDDQPVSVQKSRARGGDGQGTEVRTLETGFQRVVVALSAAGFLVLAGIISYLVYQDFAYVLPGQKVLAARANVVLDNLAVTLAVGSVLLYWAQVYVTRVTRHTQGYAEAVNGTLVMGLPGMVAMGAGIVGGWLGMEYVVQLAAVVIAGLLVVQAFELLVNSVRSYAGIEEFDQAAVDLQRLPLVPMLSGNWIVGLRSLLAQSVGLSREGKEGGERGVFARMMPKVLVAMVVLAVLSSMVRVVRPGEVAILERLGQASPEDIAHPLAAGMHFTLPWPIDELVRIPTERVQEVTVGTEDKPEEVDGQKLDFKFWAFKHVREGEKEEEYITADKQLIGTVVSVWWRVSNPSDFYQNLSHSDFIDAKGDQESLTVRPIYEAIIQSMATRAVTQTYAQHLLTDILANGREEVQAHCRRDLQDALNAMGSGIEILDLTITDAHPPVGRGVEQTAAGPLFGPAISFEIAVSSSEMKEGEIDRAKADVIEKVELARGGADAARNAAMGYAEKRVNEATGEQAWREAVAVEFHKDGQTVRHWMTYKMLDEVLPNVNKVIIGRDVLPPIIWQANSNGTVGGSSGQPAAAPPAAAPDKH